MLGVWGCGGGEKTETTSDTSNNSQPRQTRQPTDNGDQNGQTQQNQDPEGNDHAPAVTVDPRLPVYEPVPGGVGGTIKTEGSDTMLNLMAYWKDGFNAFYKNVQFEVAGKGSGSAPPALIKGAATFGPMSRAMKPSEQDDFEENFGYKATQLPTAIDVLAVYVHKDNPIARRGLTLPEVDAIFSQTRKLGHPVEITRWGQLPGMKGEWANLPISLYGRNSASGTYGYFKKHALGGGDYKDSVKEQPGSSSVVQGVTADKGGIGYSGIGYKTAGVHAIPLARSATSGFVPPDAENAYSGKYPMARYLWLTVNYKPQGELDSLRREFLKFVFSRQGQQAVVKDDYFPVSAEIARKSLERVGVRIELRDAEQVAENTTE
jgi:phosphate transport system substrate-binding protein